MSITAVAAYLQAKDLPVDGLHLSPYQGIACQTWLTNTHAIKISQAEEFQSDIFTESVAAPAVFRSRVRTPELIYFDETRAHMPQVIAIFRRASGIPLASSADLDPAITYFQLGRELKALHDLFSIPDPDHYLDPPWALDEQKIRSESPVTPPPTQARALSCLCHQDLHAENILVDGGTLSAIIDWGDAGYADPACDFRFVPPRYISHALDGYGKDTKELRTAIAWHHIDQLLYVEKRKRSYGPFADFTWEEVEEEIRCL